MISFNKTWVMPLFLTLLCVPAHTSWFSSRLGFTSPSREQKQAGAFSLGICLSIAGVFGFKIYRLQKQLQDKEAKLQRTHINFQETENVLCDRIKEISRLDNSVRILTQHTQKQERVQRQQSLAMETQKTTFEQIISRQLAELRAVKSQLASSEHERYLASNEQAFAAK